MRIRKDDNTDGIDQQRGTVRLGASHTSSMGRSHNAQNGRPLPIDLFAVAKPCLRFLSQFIPLIPGRDGDFRIVIDDDDLSQFIPRVL
jgi:hypothetical protein